MPSRARIALGTLVAALSLPTAVAHAGVASIGITDAAGGEQTVTAALKVRTLLPTIRLRLQPNATQSYTVSVIGPGGAVAADAGCGVLQDGLVVGYRGNGVYNVVVQSYPTSACDAQIGPTQSFSYTQASTVGLTAPEKPVLLREAGSTALKRISIPVTRVPGGTVEARFAKNGTVSAAGGILGASSRGTTDGAGTTASFAAKEPGPYVVVARQAVDTFATPWSAPAIVRLVAPFDLAKVSYPDTGGPVYQVRGVVREPSAAKGVVTVAIARGSRGGTFKRASEAVVSSDGSFRARFRASSGTHRIRFRFAGNTLVTSGEQIKRFTVGSGRLKP